MSTTTAIRAAALTCLLIISGPGAIHSAEAAEGVTWPDEWVMFGPGTWDDPVVPAEQLTAIPERLTIGEEIFVGREVRFTDHRLDLAQALGRRERGMTVYLFGTVVAPRDMEVLIGAGADWWMQWWVNGEPVFDTLEHGNQAQDFTLGAHVFDARLRAGENVIVARVIAGREGFVLAAGLPPRDKWEGLRRDAEAQARAVRLVEILERAGRLREEARWAEARGAYAEAVALEDTPEDIRLQARLRIAETHEAEGDFSVARVAYASLLADDLPAWLPPVVQSRLADTCFAEGDWRAAREQYAQVLRMADAHPYTASRARLRIAHCLECLGQERMARRGYERVMTMRDARPDHVEQAREAIEALEGR